MKYVIVGAGPTGLSLAYVLANNGYEVDLIEKDTQLGGSWNAQWVEGKYFSESSPRVLLYPSEFFNFLFDIGMTIDDFSNIYGNIFQTTSKFTSFFVKHFSLSDYSILIQGIIYNNLTSKESTCSSGPAEPRSATNATANANPAHGTSLISASAHCKYGICFVGCTMAVDC